MASVTEFHNVVLDYLNGGSDRKAFTKRFAELFYGIENSGDFAAVELSYAIESHLGPAICGFTTEQELRDGLARCITGASFTISIAQEAKAEKSRAFSVWSEEPSSPYSETARLREASAA